LNRQGGKGGKSAKKARAIDAALDASAQLGDIEVEQEAQAKAAQF